MLFAALRPTFLDTHLTLAPLQADISVFAVVGLAQLMVLSLGHMNMAVGRMAAMSAFAMGLAYDRLGTPLLVDLSSVSPSARAWARWPAWSSPAPGSTPSS